MTTRRTWRQFGDCPRCSRQILITQAGFLRAHKDAGTQLVRCPGSGDEPVEGSRRTILSGGSS